MSDAQYPVELAVPQSYSVTLSGTEALVPHEITTSPGLKSTQRKSIDAYAETRSDTSELTRDSEPTIERHQHADTVPTPAVDKTVQKHTVSELIVERATTNGIDKSPAGKFEETAVNGRLYKAAKGLTTISYDLTAPGIPLPLSK